MPQHQRFSYILKLKAFFYFYYDRMALWLCLVEVHPTDLLILHRKEGIILHYLNLNWILRIFMKGKCGENIHNRNKYYILNV